MKYFATGALTFLFLLSGCAGPNEVLEVGMGMGTGMSSRHHASVPEEYANLQIHDLTEADITKGGQLYTTFCASCHGDDGMGDGPTAASLDPAPAPVAHTSSMLSDGYLYWRIAEGGAAFNSTMPAWKASLNETEIWSIIGYIRALGSGEVMPERVMGSEAFDPAAETVFHKQMLTQAVDFGLITQTESDTFLFVHDAMDEYRTSHTDDHPQGNADEMQSTLLDILIKDGTIIQSQADDFARIHQLLLDKGLMD